jgi:hypothetical protein
MNIKIESTPNFAGHSNKALAFSQIIDAANINEPLVNAAHNIYNNEMIRKNYFIYHGSSHIAIHDLNEFGDPEQKRLLFITE